MSNSVIIAESSGTLARRMGIILSEEGFTVREVCADGVAALRAAQEHPPSLLVFDILLPRLSGLQLAAACSKFPTPPLLCAVSAVTARSRLEQAKQAGVRYYLLKPLDEEKFRTILRAHRSNVAQGQAQVG